MSKPVDSKQMFLGYSIYIMADSLDSAKSYAGIFSSRGALPKILTAPEDMLEVLEAGPIDILLMVTNPEKKKDAEAFAKQVADAKGRIQVFWTVSSAIIPFTDGYTPFNHQTPELLKPIYYSTLIEKDIKAHG